MNEIYFHDNVEPLEASDYQISILSNDNVIEIDSFGCWWGLMSRPDMVDYLWRIS